MIFFFQFWYIIVQRARLQVCIFSVETFLNICHHVAPIVSNLCTDIRQCMKPLSRQCGTAGATNPGTHRVAIKWLCH